MKIFQYIYLSYYSLVRDDKYLSKTGRVQFLIESVFFMLSASILFLFFGIFNVRTDNIKSIITLVFFSFLIAHLFKKIIVGKGKEQRYIKEGKNYNSKKKKTFGMIGLLGLFISFILLILSAVLMSYLWSLELF